MLFRRQEEQLVYDGSYEVKRSIHPASSTINLHYQRMQTSQGAWW